MTSGAASSTKSPFGDDWLACSKSAMAVVVSSLTEAPFAMALEAVETYRGELDAVEALLIAQRSNAGFSPNSTETILKKSGKVSKNEAKKRTKRSKVIAKNPTLAKKMSEGDISTEQIDLLAEASDKTGGDAADDTDLIDEIAGANPDQGKAIIRDYIDEHTDQSERDSRYQRQRRRRKIYKTRSLNGMSRLTIEGDDESIGAMLLSLKKKADVLYRQDGGRDVPDGEHPRSNDQRLYDAAHRSITGTTDTTDSNDDDDDDFPADEPGEAGTAPGASSGARSSKNSKTPKPKAPTPPGNKPGERPIMIFRSNIADLTDDAELLAEWTAELIGTGLVPSTLASHYRCISDFAVQITGEDGIVLKHGRTKRRVTPEQWIALVARDSGCVRCSAHHTLCEAHHLIPWTAPAKGETNIDNMVLMCVDCHHRLHEANLTLEWVDLIKKWVPRPATPDETPAPGPNRKTGDRRAKPARAPTNKRTEDAKRTANKARLAQKNW